MVKLEFEMVNLRIELTAKADEMPHTMFWIDEYDGRTIHFSGRTPLGTRSNVLCSVSLYPCLPRGALGANCSGFAYLFEREPPDKDQLFTLALGLSEKMFDAARSMLSAPARFQCELDNLPHAGSEQRDIPVRNPKFVIGAQEWLNR